MDSQQEDTQPYTGDEDYDRPTQPHSLDVGGAAAAAATATTVTTATATTATTAVVPSSHSDADETDTIEDFSDGEPDGESAQGNKQVERGCDGEGQSKRPRLMSTTASSCSGRSGSGSGSSGSGSSGSSAKACVFPAPSRPRPAAAAASTTGWVTARSLPPPTPDRFVRLTKDRMCYVAPSCCLEFTTASRWDSGEVQRQLQSLRSGSVFGLCVRGVEAPARSLFRLTYPPSLQQQQQQRQQQRQGSLHVVLQLSAPDVWATLHLAVAAPPSAAAAGLSKARPSATVDALVRPVDRVDVSSGPGASAEVELSWRSRVCAGAIDTLTVTQVPGLVARVGGLVRPVHGGCDFLGIAFPCSPDRLKEALRTGAGSIP